MRKFVVLVLILAAVLMACGAAVADKTKKTTKTTTQKGPKTVWLTELNAISKHEDNFWENASTATIGGSIYQPSLNTWFSAHYGSDILRGFSIFNLNKKYDLFEANVGLTDAPSCTPDSAEVYFYGDGNLLAEVSNPELGSARFVSFSLKGIRSLKIEFMHQTHSNYGNPDCEQVIVIGEPKLIIGAPALKKETTTTASVKTTNSETTETADTGCDGSSSIIIEPKTLEELANKLADQVSDAGLTKNGKVQLAITKFKLVDICKKSVGDNVLDDLSTYLLKTKVFKLIEREQLEKAIKELKFNLTGFIEPKKAIELGKMTGASAILIGSVSDRGSFVVINARIINTKTGEADIAENVEMRK